jgi:hypothetical protein
MYRIEYVYLSIEDTHDRQNEYMKITIFTLIGMIMTDWIGSRSNRPHVICIKLNGNTDI